MNLALNLNQAPKHDASLESGGCRTCDSEKRKEEETGAASLAKKACEKKLHACEDNTCEHNGTPHGHIKKPEAHTHKHSHDHSHDHANSKHAPGEHVHGPNCNHGHDHSHEKKEHVHGPDCGHDHSHDHDHNHDDHHHHHHDIKSPWPLEDFLANMKTPQWVRELSLNTSFLAPAFIASHLLDKVEIARTFKSWIAISAMHLLNRGHKKLPRLGLSYIVAGAAGAGKNALENQNSFIQGIPRALATAAIAIVEKFGANGHYHGPEDVTSLIKHEVDTFAKNLGSKAKWKELVPSLFNIETKVQLIAPLVKFLSTKVSKNLEGNAKSGFELVTNILGTAASFVGTDKLLETAAKTFYGKDSKIASSFGAACGCCGSPVCAAAATDTAISGTL